MLNTLGFRIFVADVDSWKIKKKDVSSQFPKRVYVEKWSTSDWNWKGTSLVQCCIRSKDSTSWKLRDGNTRWCWDEGSFNATKLPHSLSGNNSHMLQLSLDLPPLADLSLQVATSQKDSFTIFCHSSPDTKSTSYTLAGLSSAHISYGWCSKKYYHQRGYYTLKKMILQPWLFFQPSPTTRLVVWRVISILPSEWMNLEVWHEDVGWSSLHKTTKKWNG